MIQCIIIEDEPIAMEIMQDYIGDIPQLELIGSFSDALFALTFLRKNEVDLIFLDLHLPKLSGFDFLKTLKNPPKIIVTTAYHQHAVEGFELNVVDYLLKPIEFSRLLIAVNKLDFDNDESQKVSEPSQGIDEPFYFFNVNKKNVKIFLKDIYFIESLKEYVKIHLKDSYIITQFQIGEIEKKLFELDLIRIHRSYLIVQSKIEAYSSSIIEINGKQLPIGRTYKKSVIQKIENG